MHIGLYFGSFNPIHIGHLIIASYALESAGLDKVWFVVSPHNPLKESSTLLNEYDRLNLVQLAVESDQRFRASSVEFSLPRPSFTIDTLTYLQEKFPTEKFSVILGSDSYANLPRWKIYEALIRQHRFVVYNRPGHAAPQHEGANAILLEDAPLLEISATFIRRQIQAGHSVRYLLPDKVHEHILANRYYKS